MKKAFVKRSILAVFSLCFALCCVMLCVYITKEKKLNLIQREALETLEEDIGTYDEKTIVLNHTNKTTAEELAEKLGAKLRITSDGGYATLTLQNGETVRDVYSKKENRALLEKFALDYYSKTSEISETDDLIEKTFMPSTPNYTVSDALYGNQTYINYLNVGDTWNYYRGSGVTVAVIDTGIDTDHAEFIGRISEYSYNATEDKIVKDYATEDGGYDWSLIEDEQGHGTAVSGVIAAGMNGAGIAGIAPEVTLLIIKAECDENGNFYRTSDLVFGLYYAVERDADVVNMSFGTYTPENPFEKATKLAVDSDILCVAAAGNDATARLCYPAADENVIGVGALEENGTELAFYSNFGENVDVVAPGTTYTTKMGGEYGVSTGTSLASPIVAGAMALLKNQNKDLECADAIELLYASAYDLGGKGEDWYFGYGLIDLSALLVEERGKVTFDMLTDEIDGFEQIFIRNHTLQNIPEPTRTYAVFDGWYYDIHCTEELNLYDDVWTSDLTLYANWVNEDDGVPYTYVTLSDGTIEIRSYTGKRRYITIPEKIDGKIVSSIGDFAFDGQSRLRQVNLPDGLTNIGKSAFRKCNNLLEMQLPDGVKTIGEYAFAYNIRLHSIGMNENIALENIGDFAFAGSGLTRFNVPENVKSLNGSAFYGATSLKNFTVSQENENFTASSGVLFNKTKSKIVAFPAGVSASYALLESVTEIGDYAFGYAGFQDVDLNNVQSIGSSAFAYSALESVVIPDTVIFMGESAFLCNFYLKSLVIGNGLTKISEYAFTNAYKLKEVYIPEKIQEIETGAFTGSGTEKITFAENSALLKIGANAFAFTPLEEITLPKSLIIIDNRAFYAGFALSGVKFEENSALQIIGNEAFGATKSLQTIDLPNGLLQIGEYAFIDSGLSGEVAIPASVNKFGAGAFASCRNLTAIKVAAANETYLDENGVVYNADKTTLVEYPAGNTATDYTLLTTTEVIYDSAFYGSGNLDFIYLPQSLTNIERYAFYDVSNLQNIDIPENVVQISNYAFAYDGKLRSINFTGNSKLPRISYAAFAYSGIYSMRIPSNVSTVAQYAFEQCDNLQSVTFAANSKLDVVPAYMFEGANNLVNITFENGSALTAISAHGFERMNKLKTVDFGDAKIVRIDNYAFRYCENLQTIELPDTLKEVGRFAFYGDKALTRIDLPENVERIGRYAFYGTENFNVYFKSETLPANLQENWDAGIAGYYVGVTDVVENGDWKYATLTDGGVSIIKYTGAETVLNLTTLGLGGEIKQIGGYAFYRSPIESIILPETLTQIQRYAFADSALQSVTIPANVEFIGQYAFYHTALETAEFAADSTLKKIERYAFSYNRSLGKVTLPASVNELGTYAFYGSAITELNFEANSALTTLPAHAFASTKLLSVVLPDGVNYIADNAFRDCVNLQSVTFGVAEHLQVRANAFYNTAISSLELPANLEYIGEYAFIGLENLTEYKADENNPNYRTTDGVLYSKDGKKLIAFPAGKTGNFTVPKTVETIGYGAFENTKLASIEFEEGINLLTMGYRAFYNARNLTSVSVPASVVSIDFYAFAECRNLEKVTFANESKLTGIYEGAFLNCVKLSEIVIPDSIVEISDFAFYGCLSLKQLPVSDNSALKGIYDYAFAYTGLKELNVPESVTDIGAYAFRGARLTKITIPDTQMYNLLIGIGAFQDCNNLTEIALPFIGASFEDSEITWFGYIFGAGDYSANDVYVPETLAEVTISEGITTVGEGAFWKCKNIQIINVPDSVMLLDYGAFGGTRAAYQFSHKVEFTSEWAMRHVSPYGWAESPLGSGITGAFIFSGSYSKVPEYFLAETNIISLIIEEGVTEIEENACVSCDLLQELTISNTMTKIGVYAFSNCCSLTKVVLPKSITCIEDNAFGQCRGLLEVTIESENLEIKERAFGGCAYLYKITNNSNLQLNIGEDGYGMIAQNARLIIDKNGNKIYKEGNEDFTYIDTTDKFRFMQENGVYKLVSYLGNEETITLPKKLNFNGIDNDYSIYKMKGGKNIIIPEGMQIIGADAFRENQTIVSVCLSDSVTTIGDNAFYWCQNLEKVVISGGVKSIGWDVFVSCSKLVLQLNSENKYFSYKDGVLYNKEQTKIVYADCNAVDVIIPASITDIASAFSNSLSLRSIYFEKGSQISQIGYDTFWNCYNLIKINIPLSVRYIGRTFGNNDKLERIDYEGTLENWCNIKFYDSRAVSCLSEGRAVGGTKLFIQGQLVTDITLPETVSANAFSQYKHLKSVTIPANLKSIGENAFDQCEISIRIDENNEFYTLQDGILYDKNKTKIVLVSKDVDNVVIPASIEDLGVSFEKNSAITSIAFEKNSLIKKINDLAFWSCSNLKEVTLPDNLISIGAQAFYACGNLNSIIVSNTVKDIDYQAFAMCERLYKVINNSNLSLTLGSEEHGWLAKYARVMVDKNGNTTYKDDNEFTYVNTPDGFSFICENNNFILIDYFGNEETVTLPTVLTINDIDYNCTIRNIRGVKNVIIPDGVTEIASWMFTGCKTLTSVVIPDSVKVIQDYAFDNCSNLKSVIIPESVKQIFAGAFAMCDKLNDIVICGTDKHIARSAFNGSGYYNNPDNWQDGVLYCGDYVLAVQNDLTRVDVSRAKNICSAAFEETKKLTHATIGKANFAALRGATNIETLVITELPDHIYSYFTGGLSSEIPMTLKNVVLKNSCDVQNNQLFNLIKGVKIYVERDKSDCAWDTEYPRWNNGNRVYYAGEWINAVFSENGKVVSDEYYSITRVVRQPFMSDYTDEKYYYTFIGWDTDNDGLVDGIGATSVKNVYANALFKQEFRCVKEGHSGGHATCIKKVVCQYCGEEYGNAFGDHDYLHHEGKAATCTENGWEAYDTCVYCDYTTYKKIAALGHKASTAVEENRVEATCTENGHYDSVVYCSVCGEELSRELKVLAFGHNYVHHEGKAATCREKGWEAYDTCTRCIYTTYKEIAAKGHKASAEVEENRVEATCTEEGHYDGVVYCSECGEELLRGGRSLPALGHDYVHHEGKAATCTENGWEEYDTCTRCDYTTYREIQAKHNPLSAVEENRVEATCTEDGHYDSVVYCSDCGKELRREKQTINMLGHSYVYHEGKAATCKENGWEAYNTCTRCDYTTYKEIAALGHNYVHHEGKAATCTEIGWEAYDTCTRCDYTTYKEIAALGHKASAAVEENRVEATCTEDGHYDSVVYCSVCYKELSREYKTINALGHNYEHHEGKAATCTKKGWEAYNTCTRCKYTTYKEIAALGHDYVHHEGKAATCTENGWESYDTCARCDYTSYKEIEAKGHKASAAVEENRVEATCTEDGHYDSVVYCSECNKELGRAYETINALGHSYEHHEGKAATCTEIGWEAYDTCARGDYTTYKEIAAKGHKRAAAVEENRVEATCTKSGHSNVVVYCSVCHEQLRRSTKTLPALGHDYLHHEAKEATCTENGWEAYSTCTRCDYTTYQEIPAKHKPLSAVEDNRVEATCTKDGYYDSVVYCLVCTAELSREKKTISALGHDYLHHEGKAATCTETGWKEYDTCTRCDYSTYKELAAKGHTEIIDRAVAATCTKTGLTEGKHCSECSAILVAQRTTEALGHDYGEWTMIEKPTETDKGTEERVCKRCDHRDQRSVPELKEVAAFKAAVSDLGGKKNEALFTAIKAAVELYNSLSDENRGLVEKEYAELKSAIATYNEMVSAQNEAFAEANETALGLLVARLTVLAAMIYLLKRKLL